MVISENKKLESEIKSIDVEGADPTLIDRS